MKTASSGGLFFEKKGPAMSYICGKDRMQSLLLPETVEQYVEADHPVRAIDAFVDTLDLRKLKFKKSLPAGTGRPPYHPSDLLKLYVWGYFNRIRSGRQLEKECGRNLEVIWLLRQLKPDFKTICDFRKDNAEAIKSVTRQFILIARELDLYGRELVAIDGTKLKASNHPSRRESAQQLQERIKQIDERIEEYLGELEKSEREAEPELAKSKGEMKAKLERLRREKDHFHRALEIAVESQEKVALTDPECQSMNKVGLGYNAQIAVDQKHHLIAVAEIAEKPTDHKQLPVIGAQAAEVLKNPRLKVVADAGYHDQEAVAKAEEQGLESYVPRPEKGSAASNGIYTKSAFVYDGQNNSYRCPAGQVLEARGEGYFKHGLRYQAYANPEACRQCALRAKCTSDTRRVERWEKEGTLEKVTERVRQHPEIIKLRKTLVEHPFGTIKVWWNQGTLLTRGRSNAQAELSLSTLAYNLHRALAVLGVKGLKDALEALHAKLRETRKASRNASLALSGPLRSKNGADWLIENLLSLFYKCRSQKAGNFGF